MKRFIVATLALATALVAAGAKAAPGENFYEIQLHSRTEAAMLARSAADAVINVPGGYLVLAEAEVAALLTAAGLDLKLLAEGVSRADIAIDRRPDRRNAERFPVLYEQGRLRLLRVNNARRTLAGSRLDLFPLRDESPVIEYVAPRRAPEMSPAVLSVIDTLIERVSQDSLYAWLMRLEAFTHRLTGTDSNYAARDWLVEKFQSFGYDSVMIDPFIGSQLWDRDSCQSYNVIAVKPGTVSPEKQVIIGAHFDAVPDCPGADDNGSGTCCVLEAARVLADVDLPMTVIFIGFDSEESWMWGSYHYRDVAVARGDDIVFMFNPDMIGHYQNSDSANLYHGADNCLAQLWNRLATPLVGIHGALNGSTASDHLPFQEVGIPVVFVQEGVFSTEYHQPTDNTAHISFPYMTRMVKATIATLYTAASAPAPVTTASVRDHGDGQALYVQWQPVDAGGIVSYRVYWSTDEPTVTLDSADVGYGDSTYLITGLTEGVEYAIEVRTLNADGVASITSPQMTGTPYSAPRVPASFTAYPRLHAVQLDWAGNNNEIDFDHYVVFRDGQAAGQTNELRFIDDDASLGAAYHDYVVGAVDIDGNVSDTSAGAHMHVRAATLEPGRILAVNRTRLTDSWSDEQLTGAFLREALAGSDFDYRSDTVFSSSPAVNTDRLLLDDLIAYDVVVIGGESPGDPFAFDKTMPFLDSLAWYVSIGGKLVVFGRFAPMAAYDETWRYLDDDIDYNDAYDTTFHVATNTMVPVLLEAGVLQCDLVGAHSALAEYPELSWDSLATVESSSIAGLQSRGIFAVSHVTFSSGAPEVIYTYNSREDDSANEGQPIAWRYLGPDYRYVWFEFPLTCMQHDAAVAALRQAVNDVTGQATDGDEPEPTVPGVFALYQNYPNPFNPTTRIEYSLDRGAKVKVTVFNLLGQQVRMLVDDYRTSGRHVVEWDGRNGSGQPVATGVYLYRLESGNRRLSRKMLLLK